MLVNTVKNECLKLRRASVWIAFALLPVFPAVMGTFNYLQNLEILKKAWYSLWTQHTLFSSFFFMPALMGVLCAYLWRMEHLGHNWNALMTSPAPYWAAFAGKLVVATGLGFLSQIWTCALYLISGIIAGLSFDPPKELLQWILLSGLACQCIAALQLLLSMVIRSFAVPVGIALLGGILGLVMANAGKGLYCPYSLLALGMDANGRGFLTSDGLGVYIAACIAFTALPFLLATLYLKHRDVRA